MSDDGEAEAEAVGTPHWSSAGRKAFIALPVIAVLGLVAFWAHPGFEAEVVGKIEASDFIEDVADCAVGGFTFDWGGYSGSGPFNHPSLGQVTVSGSGPYGNGRPVIGTAASVPALTFSNKGHTLTLSWEYAVSELLIPYSDADFNEEITFSTDGKNTKITVPTVGPTDNFDGLKKLSGSGNDDNADPDDFSLVKLTDEGGFTSVSMSHRNIWPRGVNAILNLEGDALCKKVPNCPEPYTQLGGIGADVPGWSLGHRRDADTKEKCKKECDDMPNCAAFEFNKEAWQHCVMNSFSDAKTERQTGTWGRAVTCKKPVVIEKPNLECTGSTKPFAFKWANGWTSPELGRIHATGSGPLGRGSPVIGDAASQKALTFSNKGHTLKLSWEFKVTKMVIPYSDADFNEKITFSTNGPDTKISIPKFGPTDSWAVAGKELQGSGNDDNSDPRDFTNVYLEDEEGFTSVNMVHANIWPRGVNAILDIDGCVTGEKEPVCPEPYTQLGDFGADVPGWSLGKKPHADTKAKCKAECDAMDDCFAFEFNGERPEHCVMNSCRDATTERQTGTWGLAVTCKKPIDMESLCPEPYTMLGGIGADVPGWSLGKKPHADTKAKCKAECDAMDDCSAFEFNGAANEHCVMNSANDAKVERQTGTWGCAVTCKKPVVKTNPCPAPYTQLGELGDDVPGWSLGNRPAADTKEKCKAECDAMGAECAAFEFNKDAPQHCVMQSVQDAREERQTGKWGSAVTCKKPVALPTVPTGGSGAFILIWTITIEIKVAITILLGNVNFKYALIKVMSLMLGIPMGSITLDLFNVGGKLMLLFGLSCGCAGDKLLAFFTQLNSMTLFENFKSDLPVVMTNVNVTKDITDHFTMTTVLIKVEVFTTVILMYTRIDEIITTFSTLSGLEPADNCTTGPFELNWGDYSGTGPFKHHALGQVTVAGGGPFGSGVPIVGIEGGVPALTFGNSGHTLTLNWENAVSKISIPYHDADYDEQITFTTNGKHTKVQVTKLGPSDSFDGVNILSGTGVENNAILESYSVVQVSDDGGFSSVSMKHKEFGGKGVNGILNLTGESMCMKLSTCPKLYAQLGGIGAVVPGDGLAKITTNSVEECANHCDENVDCGAFEFNDGTCVLNSFEDATVAKQTGTLGKAVTCKKVVKDATPVIRCLPNAAFQFKWADGWISPVLGEITATGSGPLGLGAPVIGSAAGQKALTFSNKNNELVLRWETKVTQLVIPYSDADFNEKVTFSTNGPATEVSIQKFGPTDSWAIQGKQLKGTGNDDNDSPLDFTNVYLDDVAGFNSVTLSHSNILPKGTNAILDLAGCVLATGPDLDLPVVERPIPPLVPVGGGGGVIIDWTITVTATVGIPALVANVEFKAAFIKLISLLLGIDISFITLDLCNAGGKLVTLFGVQCGCVGDAITKLYTRVKSPDFFKSCQEGLLPLMKTMGVTKDITDSFEMKSVVIKASHYATLPLLFGNVTHMVDICSLKEQEVGGGAAIYLVLTTGYRLMSNFTQKVVVSGTGEISIQTEQKAETAMIEQAGAAMVSALATVLKLETCSIQVHTTASGGTLTSQFGIASGCTGEEATKKQTFIQGGSWFESFYALYGKRAMCAVVLQGIIQVEVTTYQTTTLMVARHPCFKAFKGATETTVLRKLSPAEDDGVFVNGCDVEEDEDCKQCCHR